MSGWNLEIQLWEAENEVWKELIQVKSAAAKWRHTKICHYDKLYDLFAKDKAIGKGAISAKEKVHQWEKEGSGIPFDLNDGVDESSFNFDSTCPISPPFQVTSQTAKAIKEANVIAERGIAIADRASPRYNEDEIFDELLNIGVPEPLQLDAFLFLIKSKANMRAFFGVPSNRRWEILSKLMCRSDSS